MDGKIAGKPAMFVCVPAAFAGDARMRTTILYFFIFSSVELSRSDLVIKNSAVLL